jgi:MazG family protein
MAGFAYHPAMANSGSVSSEGKSRGATFGELVSVMARLLAPGGCPWDREQTLDTLKPYLVEETYEVLDALEGGTAAEHCEELGDLLMQIVFQAALREEAGEFDVDAVIRGITDKLVRRHPHVFGDADVRDAEDVKAQWDVIKAQERAEKGAASVPRTLAGVPAAMPALARAQQLSSRAAQVGFDWPDVAGCRAKDVEELGELDAAATGGDPDEVTAEVGDLLFAAVSLARKLGVDAESALRGATRKFQRRFEHIEDRLRERDRSPRDATLDEMDALWNEAKTSGSAG